MADWRNTLAEAGITVDVVDADHVRLLAHTSHGSDIVAGSLVVQVKAYSYPITPSKLPPSPGEGPGLLVVPSATAAFLRAAQQRGWFVVTNDGTANVRIGDKHVRTRAHAEDDPLGWQRRQTRTRGPISWPRWTLARVLLASSGLPLSQADAARIVGTSPPTISRALKTLERHDLVRVEDSPGLASVIQVIQWDQLLDWWLQNYPGPGGTRSYWYSLEDLRTQAGTAVTALKAAAPAGEPVLSGDLAADYIAPWRRPDSVTIYVRRSATLEREGFVQVSGRDEATLVVCAPKDPGVWMPAPWILGDPEAQLRLADPLQVLYDLTTAAGPDAGEAADQLRAKLRSDLRERWAAARMAKPAGRPSTQEDRHNDTVEER